MTLLVFLFGWVSSRAFTGAFSDFQAIWVAGRDLLSGANPGALYEAPYFKEQIRTLLGRDFGLRWLYPPFFLPLAAATAWLPFQASYLLWAAFCLATAFISLRLLGLDLGRALLLTLFPAVLYNAAMGQTSSLFLILMTGGLLCLPRHPLLSGALFALLCFKPHLAVALPVFLVAGRYWSSLLSFALTSLLLFAAASLFWGWDIYWTWLEALLAVRDLLFDGAWAYPRLISAYGFLLALGLDHHAALALHSLYALGWLLALFMVTRRHGSFAKRLTLLALCSISLSPYAFAHDLMALVVPAAFLLRRARERGAFAWMDVAIPAVWVFSYFETIAIVPPPLAITLTAVLFMAMPDDGAAEPGGKARQRN